MKKILLTSGTKIFRKRYFLICSLLLSIGICAQKNIKKEAYDLGSEIFETEIYQIITHKEIQNSGARDLFELLRTYTHLEYGGDIDNSVSLGVRGQFGSEGKILLLVDGFEMNESGFGTLAIGGRFFLDNVKQVLICGGSESIKYGGTSELLVIKVITKNGQDLSGGDASAISGISKGAISRFTTQFAFGSKTKKGLDFNLSGVLSNSNRSNESVFYDSNFDSVDGSSTTVDYSDESKISAADFSLGMAYKGFEFRTKFNRHDMELTGTNADKVQFGGVYIHGLYEWKLDGNLVLIPKISWKKQKPWTFKGNLSEVYTDFYNYDHYRTREELNLRYTPTVSTKITAGVGMYQDKGVKNSGNPFISNGENTVEYSNLYLYSELYNKNSFLDFQVGARYDSHNEFDSGFSYHLSLLKSIKNWKLKGGIRNSFKNPMSFNMEYEFDVEPERTMVRELEIQYVFDNENSLRLNGFHSIIDDVIIYHYDLELGTDWYSNAGRLATSGFEFNYKLLKDHWSFQFGYAYYNNNDTDFNEYQVAGNTRSLLGFPRHKIFTSSNVILSKDLSITGSLVYNGKKYGYYYQSEFFEDLDFVTFDATFNFNLTLRYRVFNDFELTVGAYNILDSDYVAVSAYRSGYYGTPTMGREFTFKVAYSF